MPTNLDLARPVSSKVEIGSINLRDASVRSRIDPFDGPPDEVYLTQNFRASYQLGGADRVMVQVELNFEAAESEPGGAPESADPVVALSATFGITYRLPDVAQYGGDALQAFAELNGPYNAWPFWRELVHSVTGRVGLSTVVIPVLKLPVREVEPAEPQVASRTRAPRKRKPK